MKNGCGLVITEWFILMNKRELPAGFRTAYTKSISVNDLRTSNLGIGSKQESVRIWEGKAKEEKL